MRYRKYTLVCCSRCGKEFVMLRRKETRAKTGVHFCCDKCKEEHLKKKDVLVFCDNCGESYYTTALTALKPLHFCTEDCKKAYHKQYPSAGDIELACEYCGTHYYRPRTAVEKSKHHYCSRECSTKAHLKQTISICEECGKEFEHWVGADRKYCSKECKDQAASRIRGTKHKLYQQRVEVHCTWCGKKIYRLQRSIDVANSGGVGKNGFFCGEECRQEWFRNVYVKSSDGQANAHRAGLLSQVKMEGRTNTAPQLATNSMLDRLNIEYQNEYGIGYFSADVYIPSIKAVVEVQGDYWHSHPVFYPIITYATNYYRILHDKNRHDDIVHGRGIPVLYLWENDIMNRPELCRELLVKYIASQGHLDEYHSFNYSYSDETGLILNEDRIRPYTEYEPNELPISDKLRKELELKTA